MRLLFCDGASMCHYDVEGNVYVDYNVNEAIAKRYKRYCDDLTILLLRDEEIYSVQEAESKFNPADFNVVNIVAGPHFYKPKINFLNPRVRKEIIRIVDREVQKADRVIVRAPGRFYADTALRACRKYHKPYLVEAVEITFEYRRYGKPWVKLFAPYAEMRTRTEIARAPYVAYVTQSVLQQRYPTSGKSLGCSDVELPELDPQILETRINTYGGGGNRVIFGTAANIGSLKGQAYVVRALAELKRQGITNIEYHLAGVITTPKFQALVNSLNLQDQVKLFGPIPHGKIFDWYDTLDVYIHPSFTEGLCRSIVEAMSRALPVTCSDAGGNPELASGDMLFKAGNVGQICGAIKRMLDPEVRKSEAMRSFALAKSFQKSRLDPIRDKFYMDFINGI